METYKLWENAPHLIEGGEIPHLHYYPAEKKLGRGTVLIFAGGAYRLRSPHEDVGYAEYLNSIGLDAFVLDYRVKPYTFPAPLLDARRAVRFIRENAEKFDIDPQKIAVMGSSAGGHLAALASTYTDTLDGEGADELDKVDYRTNAQILCYPVLDMESNPGSYLNLLGQDKISTFRKVAPRLLADKSTPPLFLWHTSPDAAVDVSSSLRYAIKLHELGIPVEMHVYPIGAHGLGLANREGEGRTVPHVQSWAPLLREWLKFYGWIAN